MDQCIAMENPPELVEKILGGLKGLSFTKGQYGILRLPFSVNEKIVNKINGKKVYPSFILDNVNSLDKLLKELNNYIVISDEDIISFVDNPKKLKSLLIVFEDMNIITREINRDLFWFPI